MAHIFQEIIGDGFIPKVTVLDDDRKAERLAFSRAHQGKGMLGGVRFPPELVPRRFVIEGKRMPARGVFECVVALAVDDRFVDAVEALTPGVHQFLPIDITIKDGLPLARPQFLLNCCTRI